jgi:hypothetical protein
MMCHFFHIFLSLKLYQNGNGSRLIGVPLFSNRRHLVTMILQLPADVAARTSHHVSIRNHKQLLPADRIQNQLQKREPPPGRW